MLLDTAKRFVKDTGHLLVFVDPSMTEEIQKQYNQEASITEFGPISRLILGRGELKEASDTALLPTFTIFSNDNNEYFTITAPRIRLVRKANLYSLKLDLEAYSSPIPHTSNPIYTYPFFQDGPVTNEFRFSNWFQLKEALIKDPQNRTGLWTGALYTYKSSSFSNADSTRLNNALNKQFFYPSRDQRFAFDNRTAKFCKALYTWLDTTLQVYKEWIMEDFKDQVEQSSTVKIVAGLFSKEQQAKYISKKAVVNIWR